MYDLIGDIHGYAAELKQLLHELDYREVNGCWQHPTRTVIFLGDYIDRGPAIREVLHLVKNMVDGEHAIALMGNHEYNALAYHYKLPNGNFLREHSDKNIDQHKATLEQFKDYPEEWKSFLEWFYTLPLYLDETEFRAVHACWDEEYIQWLKDNKYQTMTRELLHASHERNTEPYKVIDAVLKGKEMKIPDQFAWFDKGRHLRTENRIKWWKEAKETVHGEFLFDCPAGYHHHPVDKELKYVVYPSSAKPIFFGHYWLNGDLSLQERNVACLDYSVAENGYLVAYRFNGEKVLDEKNFHRVKAIQTHPSYSS